jgi:prepilin-type N-terminal cleavage/methylation domain-containing protein
MSVAKASRAARAFTMIELLIGLAVSAVVMTAITVVYADATNFQRQQRIRQQLAQGGGVFDRQFNSELRTTGLGRAANFRLGTTASINAVYGGTGTTVSPINTNQTFVQGVGGSIVTLMLVGDVPRPDANFETFGLLSDAPVGHGKVAFSNDHTGSCAPTNPVTTGCDSGLFPSSLGSTCQNVLDRGCAWAGKRLRADDVLQIVTGDGMYQNVQVASTMTAAPAPGSQQMALSLQTGGTFPYPAATVWPNAAPGDAPADVRGQGWVATMDRVFYRYCPGAIVDFGVAPSVNANCGGTRLTNEARVIERMQCWGPVDVTNAAWTNAANPALQTATCTAWEPVLRDVDSVRFAFSDISQSVPAMPRELTYEIKLVKRYGKGSGTELRHTLRNATRLRNVR